MTSTDSPNITSQSKESIPEAVSFEDFKKALGAECNKYSEQQLKRLFEMMDQIASALFDGWLKQINANN